MPIFLSHNDGIDAMLKHLRQNMRWTVMGSGRALLPTPWLNDEVAITYYGVDAADKAVDVKAGVTSADRYTEYITIVLRSVEAHSERGRHEVLLLGSTLAMRLGADPHSPRTSHIMNPDSACFQWASKGPGVGMRAIEIPDAVSEA